MSDTPRTDKYVKMIEDEYAAKGVYGLGGAGARIAAWARALERESLPPEERATWSVRRSNNGVTGIYRDGRVVAYAYEETADLAAHMVRELNRIPLRFHPWERCMLGQCHDLSRCMAPDHCEAEPLPQEER